MGAERYLNLKYMKRNSNYTWGVDLKLVMGIILLVAAGCKNGDDDELAFNEADRILIADDTVENEDVFAADYWDNAVLVWSDEFNTPTLNNENWLVEVYAGGQGNSQLQNYTDANYEVSNGTLKITANKESDNRYTSSRLSSKYSFKFGRIEYRVKLPAEKGNGLWVKTWLLGSDFRSIGNEAGTIDMMRYFSYLPNQINSTIISLDDINNNNPNRERYGPLALATAEEEFHTYGMLWTDRYIKFYIDEVANITNVYMRPANATIGNWPFSNSFYAVMNMDIGGELAGAEGVDDTIFPANFEVDYIRVYHAN